MGIARWLALALLAGCASSSAPVWTHPTKDPLEWRTDLAECERFFGGSEREQNRCMTGKGWTRAKR